MTNPYWDMVRDHIDPTGSLWGTPEVRRWPSELGMSGEDFLAAREALPNRDDLVHRYAWTITDPDTVTFVATHAHGSSTPMAGTGWWALILTQTGVDVVSYDIDPGGNQWHKGAALHVDVTRMPGVESVAKHPDRTLFLSWPPYDRPDGVDVLRAYAGNRVILISEGPGGCVGDDDLFNELDEHWAEAAGHTPVQWQGIHDHIAVYERQPS